MNPNTNHQQYWNDEPNWEHRSEYCQPRRAKICLERMEERQAELNDYPPEMADDWEEVKQYHICWHCGEQGHENGMMRNKLHYWVHIECEIYINKLNQKS
jgi:hypothetical protein